MVMAAIIEAGGMYFIQKYYQTSILLYYFLSLLTYALILIVILHSFKYANLAIGYSLWNGFAIILVVAISYFVFRQKTKPREIIGIILILIAVFLITS